jgi:hypothetical protein
MDRETFGRGMAFLQAAMQVTAPEATLNAYWHLLRDLTPEVWQQAILAAAASHHYHTLPPVAEIRRHAQAAVEGVGPTWEEALAVACRAINRAGGNYATPEQRQEVLSQMPGLLGEMTGRFWKTICHSEEAGVLRGQWRQAWEAAERRSAEVDRLPPAVRPRRIGPDLGTLFKMPRGIE